MVNLKFKFWTGPTYIAENDEDEKEVPNVQVFL